MVIATSPQIGTRTRRISIALWVVQGLLALLFAFAGVMKFLVPVAEMAKQTHLSPGFLYFIGVAEVVGAVALILPGLLRVRPILTPIAAMGLLVIMFGAIYITASSGAGAILPAVTALLLAFVAYGRMRLAPIAAKA